MFETGDAVAHPIRGAGTVAGVEEREWHESPVSYYKIELIDPPGTDLWVPASMVEDVGLRRAITPSELDQVWSVLRDAPNTLPENPKERQALLEETVGSGDILQIGGAVRDISWRGQHGKLRAASEQLLDRGMKLLTGEVALAQSISLSEARSQIISRLHDTGDLPPR